MIFGAVNTSIFTHKFLIILPLPYSIHFLQNNHIPKGREVRESNFLYLSELYSRPPTYPPPHTYGGTLQRTGYATGRCPLSCADALLLFGSIALHSTAVRKSAVLSSPFPTVIEGVPTPFFVSAHHPDVGEEEAIHACILTWRLRLSRRFESTATPRGEAHGSPAWEAAVASNPSIASLMIL